MPVEKRTISDDSMASPVQDSPSVKRPRQDTLPESESDNERAQQWKRSLLSELLALPAAAFLVGLLHQENYVYGLEPLILETLKLLGKYKDNLTPFPLSSLEKLSPTRDVVQRIVNSLKDEECAELRKLYFGFLNKEPDRNIASMLELDAFKAFVGLTGTSIDASLSIQATEKSWSKNYKGKAHESLWRHIETLCNECKRNSEKYYAKYCSIVQSSGMGKSRLVDEMSKTHFTIPFCLRSDNSGFPPADVKVRDYLTSAGEEEKANEIAQAFLTSLFLLTNEWIQENCANDFTIDQVASAFRSYMCEDQKYERPGNKRTKFFERVLESAVKLHKNYNDGGSGDKKESSLTSRSMSTKAPGSPDRLIIWRNRIGSSSSLVDIIIAAESLEKTLLKFKSDRQNISSPLIILSFDEAHTLGKIVKLMKSFTTSQPTHFSCLRRAPRKIQHQAVFSLFLSTTGQVFQFTPPRGMDTSERIHKEPAELTLMQLYTDLGYDMLAEQAVEGHTKMYDVMRVDYLVKLGRPLFATQYESGVDELKQHIIPFAAQKLTKMEQWRRINPTNIQHEDALLACLMCRLGLDFNRWSYEGREREMRHVENHMRVCLQAKPSFDGVYSISPSEPILAEGARLVMMSNPFNAASILANEYRRPEIERGARGETVVKLLVTLATDMVAVAGKPGAWNVTTFMKTLCGSPSSEDVFVCDVLKALPSCIHPNSGITPETPFQEAFGCYAMNMNHFTKAGSSAVLNRNFSWGHIPRCGAWECSSNQKAIDAVIPIMHCNDTLGRHSVTFILIQVKNDIAYGSKPDPLLFDAMDPFELGLFSNTDEDYSVGCLPIIRIVVALAST